jgi:hypothetical protein
MTKCVSALLAIVALAGGCGRHPAWTYKGDFHNKIAQADRVVVVDAGFDCFGQDTKAKTLFELSKPDEIRQLAEQLEFQKSQTLGVCPCNGYPRIDWYRGKERLVTVSVQHCKAIRWKGFQADATLTPKSGEWLHEWLTAHHVDAAKMK